MSEEKSRTVELWMEWISKGDVQVAEELWRLYFPQLVQLASRNLGNVPRRIADEEDVALSAFHSFVRGAQKGRFPDISERDDLWKLLMTITLRKIAKLKRQETAQKRGGGKVRGESAFVDQAGQRTAGLDGLNRGDVDPALLVETMETCQQMLDHLGDPTLREIALLRLEGYSNQEISEKLEIALRSVERKLELIRKEWS